MGFYTVLVRVQVECKGGECVKYIDLRSDTVTQPTEAMRKAMFDATVGDDIMREDPTVKKLEELSAELFNKESALFVASGTMGNQLAVMTWAQRGEEIIVGDTSHIYALESGGLSTLSQVQTKAIQVEDGVYNPQTLEDAIHEKGIQQPRTSLICLENTQNLNAGFVVPQENLKQIRKVANKYKLPIHLDGARIFNASIASGESLEDIACSVDSLMFALTKGLAAPFGGILTGNKEFIEEARYFKQRLGGGFRQAGFMAAAGIVALETMIPRLEEDHYHAALLAKGLRKFDVLQVNPEKVQTNIVTGSVSDLDLNIDEFLNALKLKGVLIKRISKENFRMVTHFGIQEEDIDYVLKAVDEVLNQIEN